jgi:glycosyltransferase involved in cell wall biosynthesis
MKTYDCVIPVYNEAADLEKNIRILHAFLTTHLSAYDWFIIIADNASTDATPAISANLAASLPRVAYNRLEQKGRGRALKTTWMRSNADFVSYMDVDLSTNLKAVPQMMELFEKGIEVVLGSRIIAGAAITRCWHREILSRGWNFLVGAVFNTRFSDAQCGFKGLTREAKEILVPQVEDKKWFFDTELLVLADKQGFRMNEIAVEWIEDLGSTVHVTKTMFDDLRAMLRLRLQIARCLKMTRPASRPSGEGFRGAAGAAR